MIAAAQSTVLSHFRRADFGPNRRLAAGKRGLLLGARDVFIEVARCERWPVLEGPPAGIRVSRQRGQSAAAGHRQMFQNISVRRGRVTIGRSVKVSRWRVSVQ